MFNKKFDGKYKDVRRPIICNGLKEIKAYKIEVVEHSIPSSDEEFQEPQPVEDFQEPSPEPQVSVDLSTNP